MPTPLKPGDLAPDFSLLASTGETISLADLRGSPVVVYFYPKDDTPGCTTQACSFRDHYAELCAAGAAVLGISVDGLAAHGKFVAKHQLPFPLLADTEHRAVEAYGVWAEKSLYGRWYMGTERATFLIAADGRLVRVWPQATPKDHALTVLAALRQLE